MAGGSRVGPLLEPRATRCLRTDVNDPKSGYFDLIRIELCFFLRYPRLLLSRGVIWVTVWQVRSGPVQHKLHRSFLDLRRKLNVM